MKPLSQKFLSFWKWKIFWDCWRIEMRFQNMVLAPLCTVNGTTITWRMLFLSKKRHYCQPQKQHESEEKIVSKSDKTMKQKKILSKKKKWIKKQSYTYISSPKLHMVHPKKNYPVMFCFCLSFFFITKPWAKHCRIKKISPPAEKKTCIWLYKKRLHIIGVSMCPIIII